MLNRENADNAEQVAKDLKPNLPELEQEDIDFMQKELNSLKQEGFDLAEQLKKIKLEREIKKAQNTINWYKEAIAREKEKDI
jgi:hypothetical protein